jgi:hypothetical protein
MLTEPLERTPSVSKARGVELAVVQDLVKKATVGRSPGFLGQEYVNVVTLNLALDKAPPGGGQELSSVLRCGERGRQPGRGVDAAARGPDTRGGRRPIRGCDVGRIGLKV